MPVERARPMRERLTPIGWAALAPGGLSDPQPPKRVQMKIAAQALPIASGGRSDAER